MKAKITLHYLNKDIGDQDYGTLIKLKEQSLLKRSFSATCEISQQECVGGTRYQEVRKCVEVKIRGNNLVHQWGVVWSTNPH